MTSDYSSYTRWLESGQWIRNSVRMLIFDSQKQQILIEQNDGFRNTFYNFIGGGIEIGETLDQCLIREFREELNIDPPDFEYRFVVENHFLYEGKKRHCLEFYYQIVMDNDLPLPSHQGVTYTWIPLKHLESVDLRPLVVRNCLLTGKYQSVQKLTASIDRSPF